MYGSGEYQLILQKFPSGNDKKMYHSYLFNTCGTLYRKYKKNYPKEAYTQTDTLGTIEASISKRLTDILCTVQSTAIVENVGQ